MDIKDAIFLIGENHYGIAIAETRLFNSFLWLATSRDREIGLGCLMISRVLDLVHQARSNKSRLLCADRGV